ncbi:L,D-transpeptidase [Psychrobacter sp. C 20.9]|uniref:Peptidase n=1 Tax=Psychrobacter piscatorii TaxID=554343 RepID=A0A0T6DMJ8_9GAMM|nr:MULTISPECIES: L,D-transpeptidase [Psychrobacter]KRU21237.1 peptidase [Psychrobacter piscatorii]OLF35985.1 L,D-transpeptidase [Psychrobacter sp. C 20.9]
MTNNETFNKHLVINIAKQTLKMHKQQAEVTEYTVSTAKNGFGSQQDSGCTPLGQHIIAKKIGGSEPMNAVFVGRVPTGEVYDAALSTLHPKRDWILSRILWLSGLEEGSNKGSNSQGGCDTYERYIYIHGTPDTEPMGIPLSHGCIRMRNTDIVELFEQVEEGMPVMIVAD